MSTVKFFALILAVTLGVSVAHVATTRAQEKRVAFRIARMENSFVRTGLSVAASRFAAEVLTDFGLRWVNMQSCLK